MLLVFRKWCELDHFSIRSENIDHVDEHLGHGVIVTKEGNRIEVWENFRDVITQVNAAMEKDNAAKNNKPEEEKEETITLSEARARLNSIFGRK